MEVTLNQHITITPGVRSGKPHITGRRITVADVVIMHLRLGQALEEIAGLYELSLASVYAAMAFYYDHKPEIDRSIADSEQIAAALRPQYPSLLQKKLSASTRA
ncbi:MAG: DUF433 domain-containing protein [Cyanobacteria bacterium P01_G01_bin.54]